MRRVLLNCQSGLVELNSPSRERFFRVNRQFHYFEVEEFQRPTAHEIVRVVGT